MNFGISNEFIHLKSRRYIAKFKLCLYLRVRIELAIKYWNIVMDLKEDLWLSAPLCLKLLGHVRCCKLEELFMACFQTGMVHLFATISRKMIYDVVCLSLIDTAECE